MKFTYFSQCVQFISIAVERLLLFRYLSELLSNNTTISRPDFRYVLRSVYSNSNQGLDVTLSFFEENLTEILNRYVKFFNIILLILIVCIIKVS